MIKKARKFSKVLLRGFQWEHTSTVVHPKSWLEVCDAKHRYGAHLRVYYEEWKRLNKPQSDFFTWLDSTEDQHCSNSSTVTVPRSQLDSETVRYCYTEEERAEYKVRINENGRLWSEFRNTPLDTTSETDGFIFVLRDNVLYAGRKETVKTPRLHHTSFVAGECVQAAGMMVVNPSGVLTHVYPHSGHYRPAENEVRILLNFLINAGVDISNTRVDVQRLQKVARTLREDGTGLEKKIKHPVWWNGMTLFWCLSHKHKTNSMFLFEELRYVVNKAKVKMLAMAATAV